MASLIVTFGRVSGLSGVAVPLEDARHCRTEVLTIEGLTETADVTDMMAGAGDTVCTVYAEADCWIAIGPGTPDPTADYRRFVKSGTERQFAVLGGYRVAVTEYVAS